MNNHPNKFIFFGSSEFSVIVLKELLKNGLRPEAVVTTPDKPVGRKQILTPTPVKILALAENIVVLQPEKLDENFYINVLGPRLRGDDKCVADFFVVASYGKIIPKNILDLPKKGCLNIHPSLLPKYRGASPIQTALLNDDKETGVTIMLMDEKMDHGNIVSCVQCPISEKENFLELHNKLAIMGAEILIKILPDFLASKIKSIEQNHSEATFTKIIKKTDGEIDWQKSAKDIYNQWRAFHLWPGVFFVTPTFRSELNHTKIKFTEIKLTEIINKNISAGEFIVINKKLYVVAGDKKLLEIIKLQPEGKKEMTASEFINGYLK